MVVLGGVTVSYERGTPVGGDGAGDQKAAGRGQLLQNGSNALLFRAGTYYYPA